jgi:pyridoxine 5'-phosphate synthase
MIRLSINVNKVATLRNSRGGAIPSVIDAVRVCVDEGAPGITVHPREDGRHITATDVIEVAAFLRTSSRAVEFNIEGDPRPDLLALVSQVKPTQCTLVPVRPGEITSQAGWSADTPRETMGGIVRSLREQGIRVSLFVDPEDRPIRWAAEMQADRVELYTEPFARAFERGSRLRRNRSRSMPVPPISRRLLALASTPGTIWISTTFRCSAGCRTWPRCRSAMPSSATRCSWASPAASASISTY